MIDRVKEKIIASPKGVANDERGIIEQLVDGSFNSVLRITSKKGTVRANHYHKQGSHVCYLVRGRIHYLERPVLAEAEKEKAAKLSLGATSEYLIEPGQLFYSAPMVAHAMEFLEDSEFYTFTTEKRTPEGYEEDLVRVTLIDPNKVKQG